MPSQYENRLYIAGSFTLPAETGTFPLHSAATEEHVTDVHIAGQQDIDRAVAAAKAAQPAWAEKSGADRAAVLYKFAELVERDAEKIKALDAVAMGRPVGEQWLDIHIGAARIRYEASLAQSLVGESSVLTPGQLNLVLRQPYGCTAGILPFNFPTLMWISKVAPSIAAGNSIIVKPSEKSPLGALHLAGLTKEAGFPDGLIQVVNGLGPTGKMLAEHMEIRKISFTGSTRTGRFIAQAAAMSNLKEVCLELGGKSPTIIFEDADLDAAAPAAAFSISWNSGQLCMANSRIYVQESIRDAFMEKFKKAYNTYKHGDPLAKDTTMGPQADAIQGKAVLAFIEEGKKSGKLEMGGERVGDKGYFIQPTIFSGVPDDAKINTDEVFGPVVVVHTFKEEVEAVRRANDSEYGLYAAVFTKDIDRAIRVAKKLDAGTVGINATSPSTANELPFGGFKGSGFGSREGGVDSLKHWTEEKAVVIKYA